MKAQEGFRLLTAGFLAALIVAGLGLITNLVEPDKMPWLIGAILALGASAAAIVYVLEILIVRAADAQLNAIKIKCEEVLSNISAGHVAALLNNSVISDAELDRLERAPETKEVWIFAPGNLEYDIPGMVFFSTLQHNIDDRNISYTYFIRDNDDVRHNVAEINNKMRQRANVYFVVMSDDQWEHLPIVGIPVTIHNPNGTDHDLRIYIATQDQGDRGSYWSVFTGWTVARIIGRVRAISKNCTKLNMEKYLASDLK